MAIWKGSSKILRGQQRSPWGLNTWELKTGKNGLRKQYISIYIRYFSIMKGTIQLKICIQSMKNVCDFCNRHPQDAYIFWLGNPNLNLHLQREKHPGMQGVDQTDKMLSESRVLHHHGIPNLQAHLEMGTVSLLTYMGVSLNGGTPKTPQNDHF